MGFNLHGKNPVNPTGIDEPQIDWDRNITDEEWKEYSKEMNAYEKAVPGSSFHRNVWHWRPIWTYVAETCNNILTHKDITMGQFNDGHFINKNKSKRIAKRLQKLIDEGHSTVWESEHTEEREDAEEIPCRICKGKGVRSDSVIKGKCNVCEGKGTEKPNWAWYPFYVENLQEFTNFCRDSGGFNIC